MIGMNGHSVIPLPPRPLDLAQDGEHLGGAQDDERNDRCLVTQGHLDEVAPAEPVESVRLAVHAERPPDALGEDAQQLVPFQDVVGILLAGDDPAQVREKRREELGT